MYTEKLIEHFEHPRNVGEIPDADGRGMVGDPSCGDYLTLSIKVARERITAIKFKAYGCPAAIATTSILTEIALGKTLEEALKITDWDIVVALGGLPDPKIHCSNLGALALHQAILDYRVSNENKGQPDNGRKQDR